MADFNGILGALLNMPPQQSQAGLFGLLGQQPMGPMQSFMATPNERVRAAFEALLRQPSLYGERGDDKLYLDKQDKYVLGKIT